MHKNLVVFDIETVPDYEAAANLLDMKGASEDELKTALLNYHLQLTDGKNSFFRQPFHKVVAISILEAEIQRNDGRERFRIKDIRSGGKLDSTESELVSGFFAMLSSRRPRLVSFNGRTFDMPVLKYRAMRHKVEASSFYNAGDKWNSYTSRYSLDWHCDLLEALSDFGASARVKLNEVCAMLGVPGKFDIDGSQVEDFYKAGELKRIRDYCELDVASTYLVYLHYAQHMGIIDNLDESVDEFIEMLTQKQDQNPALGEFIDRMMD